MQMRYSNRGRNQTIRSLAILIHSICKKWEYVCHIREAAKQSRIQTGIMFRKMPSAKLSYKTKPGIQRHQLSFHIELNLEFSEQETAFHSYQGSTDF